MGRRYLILQSSKYFFCRIVFTGSNPVSLTVYFE